MEMFKKKVENIFQVLGFQLPLFAATDLVYRKPSPSIFEQFFEPLLEEHSKIQMVGDAAGRQGDFADSDRAFAYNICMVTKSKDPTAHISFRTPEEYFLKEKPKKVTWFSSFDPQKYLDSFSSHSKESPENLIKETLKKYPCGVYFLVGPPASGKSMLTESALPDAVVVSKDKQGSKALATLQKALQTNQNKNPENPQMIVIDDTNPTVEAREKYLKEIPKSIPRVCILTLGYRSSTDAFNLESKADRSEQIEIAKHFMKMRMRSALLAGEEPREIPDIAYNMYNAKFQFPTKAEGFDEIIQIPLTPHFSNDDELLNFLLKF
jgi:bifunctional polynucleotide phosphatase/kinase